MFGVLPTTVKVFGLTKQVGLYYVLINLCGHVCESNIMSMYSGFS